MGHRSKNRKHQGVTGVLANPSRPRRRREGVAEATIAMAGGRKLAAHATRPQEAMKREIDSTGRERGARGFSPWGKMGRRRLGDGGSRGEAGGGTGDPRRGGYLGHGRREREKGTAGRAGKGSAPFL